MGGPFDIATDDCAVRLAAGAENAGRSLSASAWMSMLSKVHQKIQFVPCVCLVDRAYADQLTVWWVTSRSFRLTRLLLRLTIWVVPVSHGADGARCSRQIGKVLCDAGMSALGRVSVVECPQSRHRSC